MEFLIQRESDHTAIVSVAPGQGGFDMTFAETTSPYDTTNFDGLPFPKGWRTVVVDLVQAFDPTTNNSGTGSTSIAQLPLSSWGTSVNTMQQNGYALTGGTDGVTLLNSGANRWSAVVRPAQPVAVVHRRVPSRFRRVER